MTRKVTPKQHSHIERVSSCENVSEFLDEIIAHFSGINIDEPGNQEILLVVRNLIFGVQTQTFLSGIKFTDEVSDSIISNLFDHIVEEIQTTNLLPQCMKKQILADMRTAVHDGAESLQTEHSAENGVKYIKGSDQSRTKRPRLEEANNAKSKPNKTREINEMFDFSYLMTYGRYSTHQKCVCSQLPVPEFKNDSDFVQNMEIYFIALHWFQSLSNVNTSTNLMKKLESLKIRDSRIMGAAFASFVFLQFVIQVRLQAKEWKPRVVRVTAAFGMIPCHCAAVVFVLCSNAGVNLPTCMSNTNTSVPAIIGRVCGIDPEELQRFMASDSEHIKQGLIQVTDTRILKIPSDFQVTMATEVVSTLLGINLVEEEFIKLERTCLGNVVEEERKGNFGLITSIVGERTNQCVSSSFVEKNVSKKKKGITFNREKLKELLGNEYQLDSDSDCDDGEGSGNQDDASRGGSTSANNTPSIRANTPPRHVPMDLNGQLKVKPGLQTPYTTDIEYVDDAFKALAHMIKARNSEGDMKDEDDNYFNTPKTKVEAQLREQLGKQRVALARVESRMEATKNAGSWIPRIERVTKKLTLSPFEKQILLLLVGNVVSHDILVAINGRYVMRDGQRELTVGYILFVLCENLKERVACRKCFYQSSPLISNGLISVAIASQGKNRFNTDLMDYLVDIDRTIVDYLMGTETDTDELVQGSKLYDPKVLISNVVLPSETKEKVMSTIEHYGLFSKCKSKCGFGEGLGCGGSALVFLFYGPSGTGKTMLANAVSNDLKKKILLVNLLQFKGDSRAPEMLRFVFREAKLNDAIIFFDECEGFFEQRESNQLVTSVLAEFERYDGMIILATNRAQIIDEAMNRRISLMIEFKLPDHQMRCQIWKTHLPKHLTLDKDVCIESLAIDYELNGGLIRNAVLAAISDAVAREKTETPVLKMADLTSGAKQQLRGFFQTFENPTGAQQYITPRRSLDEFVSDSNTKKLIEEIAKVSKSRNTLFSQWGFNEHECQDQAEICLFHGPSGTGKSLALEAIAYECGATIRLCNVAEMLLSKENVIPHVFEEARKLGAVVAFDQAQSLFDYSDRSTQLSQLIQYHAIRYPRPVIAIATTGTGVSSIDTKATNICFTTEILFQLPGKALRKELWKRALPSKVPIKGDINYDKLADDQLSAKMIRTICFSACCKQALLPPMEQALTMEKLLAEKDEVVNRERRRSTHSSMFT